MFDIASSELLLIAVVAVLVIGPKDLPRALYKFGQVVGKARGMARHFRSGIDAMIREAELEELQKQWAKQNQAIMEKSGASGQTNDSAASEASEVAAVEPAQDPDQAQVAPTQSAVAVAPDQQALLPLDPPASSTGRDPA